MVLPTEAQSGKRLILIFSLTFNILIGLEIINNIDQNCMTQDEDGNEMKYKYFTIYPQVDGRIQDISK